VIWSVLVNTIQNNFECYSDQILLFMQRGSRTRLVLYYFNVYNTLLLASWKCGVTLYQTKVANKYYSHASFFYFSNTLNLNALVLLVYYSTILIINTLVWKPMTKSQGYSHLTSHDVVFNHLRKEYNKIFHKSLKTINSHFFKMVHAMLQGGVE